MSRVLNLRPIGNNVHRNIQQLLTIKLGISVAMTTDQINDLDQIYMVVRRQLKKPVFFPKHMPVIQQFMAISDFPILRRWKLFT